MYWNAYWQEFFTVLGAPEAGQNPYLKPKSPSFGASRSAASSADLGSVAMQLKLITEHGHQAFCLWQKESGCLSFSENWQRITSLTPEECHGIGLIEFIHPDHLPAVEAQLTKEHAHTEIGCCHSTVQAKLMRAGATWGWYELMVLHAPEHQPSIILLRDITHEVEIQHQLENTKRAVSLAEQSKSSFLSNMSHELRTPLNAILGFAQMIEAMGKSMSEDQYLEYLRHIKDSGNTLLSKINDLLEVASIDARNCQLYEEPINVCDIVEGAMEMHTHAAFSKGVRICREKGSCNVVINGDRTKLMHSVSHLIANAVRFSNEGDRISIQCRANDKDGVHITIQDSGCGIGAEQLANIHQALNQNGTYFSTDIMSVGLGLSVSKEFAALHGGNLTIDSVKNRGTIVTIRLPRERIISLSGKVKSKSTKRTVSA